MPDNPEQFAQNDWRRRDCPPCRCERDRRDRRNDRRDRRDDRRDRRDDRRDRRDNRWD